MKVLNLYAGIGGNRKLWKDCEVTAVELNPEVAEIYKSFFSEDNIIIGDAHEYLRLHFREFDFIWSSPPCQSHSSFRQNICVRFRGTEPVYPDMKLYQEIIFLQNNFKGRYVVENVKPYYKALIEPTVNIQRHLFWANFKIENCAFIKDKIRAAQIPDLQKTHGFDLSKIKIANKRQILRNCVYPEIGEYIFNKIRES
jgi:DNA (cytosine-5)-methyltransferase 1